MPEPREMVLRPRSGEAGERIFRPKDFPELWAQGKGRQGLGAFTEVMQRNLDSPEAAAIWQMFVPSELGAVDPDQSYLDFPSRNNGKFELALIGDRFQVEELSGWIDPAKGKIPTMLEVSEYGGVDFDLSGGSQAFYRNFAYQVGHMDIPVIYSQNVPTALAYFMHRLGQVPVALLADQHAVVRDHIIQKLNRPVRTDFPSFSYTVGIHGVEPQELLAPQYREPMHRMQALFDSMDEHDRQTRYIAALKAEFGLTDR